MIKLEDLGIDIAPRLKVEKVAPPEERAGGVMVADVDELIDKLRNEAKVLWVLFNYLLWLDSLLTILRRRPLFAIQVRLFGVTIWSTFIAK